MPIFPLQKPNEERLKFCGKVKAVLLFDEANWFPGKLAGEVIGNRTSMKWRGRVWKDVACKAYGVNTGGWNICWWDVFLLFLFFYLWGSRIFFLVAFDFFLFLIFISFYLILFRGEGSGILVMVVVITVINTTAVMFLSPTIQALVFHRYMQYRYYYSHPKIFFSSSFLSSFLLSLPWTINHMHLQLLRYPLYITAIDNDNLIHDFNERELKKKKKTLDKDNTVPLV